MTNTLASPRLQAVLSQLFAAVAVQEADDTPPPPPPAGRPSWDAASAQERADAFADAYIPISAEAGKLLYALVRAIRPQTVVEFGTSFGVAALPGPIGVVLLDGWTELCLPVLRMEISSWTGPQVRA